MVPLLSYLPVQAKRVKYALKKIGKTEHVEHFILVAYEAVLGDNWSTINIT